MSATRNFFFVTKPLQYINCLNIATVGPRILLLINNFYNAEKFFEKAQKSNLWAKTLFFTSETEAYKYIYKNIVKEDSLFIDSDYGFRTSLKLSKVRTKNIFVYEEGIGTYRNDLLSSNDYNFIKRELLRLWGVKEYMGGSKFVKGLFVYDHERHKKNVLDFSKERLSFRADLLTAILENQIHFIDEGIIKHYVKLVKNKEVVLYLTNWKYNEEIEKFIMNSFEINDNTIILIKPHPSFKDYDKINIQYNEIISAEILAEILFILFYEHSKQFIILHENSSSLQYWSSLNNISFL